eukprot:gene9625-6888_t
MDYHAGKGFQVRPDNLLAQISAKREKRTSPEVSSTPEENETSWDKVEKRTKPFTIDPKWYKAICSKLKQLEGLPGFGIDSVRVA